MLITRCLRFLCAGYAGMELGGSGGERVLAEAIRGCDGGEALGFGCNVGIVNGFRGWFYVEYEGGVSDCMLVCRISGED